MTRVTIRVETTSGEVEVSEESPRNGDWVLRTLLERSLGKIHKAYDLVDANRQLTEGGGVRLSDTNRALLLRAYDDGEGGTVSFKPSDVAGYFQVMYDGDQIMEGTEVNGTLYSICPQSGGGMVALLVGDEIANVDLPGRAFPNAEGARQWITENTRT